MREGHREGKAVRRPGEVDDLSQKPKKRSRRGGESSIIPVRTCNNQGRRRTVNAVRAGWKSREGEPTVSTGGEESHGGGGEKYDSIVSPLRGGGNWLLKEGGANGFGVSVLL